MAWEGSATVVLTRNDGTTASYSQLAQNLPVMVETKPLDMGSDRLKQFAGAVLEIAGESEGVMSLAFLDRLGDATTWSVALAMDNSFQHFFPQTARYVRVRLRDANPQERWKVNGLSLYGMQLKGRW